VKTDETVLTLHELIAILLEEDCHHWEQSGDPYNVTMTGKCTNKGEEGKKFTDSEKECYNSHKPGQGNVGPKEVERRDEDGRRIQTTRLIRLPRKSTMCSSDIVYMV